jgi:hypothetical protein
VVPKASAARVVRGTTPDLLPAFIDAGLALVAEGAQAIGTSCGFLALWQRDLQAALPVPVWTSSLLQLADEPTRRCGVLTIEAASITPAHLQAVGADPATPVEGIDAASRLHATLMQDLPTLDTDEARAQVVAAGLRLCRRHPEVNTLVLECTNLPPYAQALHEATGRPVLDVLSLLRGRMAALSGG